MHPFLEDPENAKAYQTLCDCPSGSTRSWAAKAGWTRSRMERFLLQLRALGLARIDVGLKGSTFVPGPSVSDASQTRPAADLGSKAVTLDKVPRYGEAPANVEKPLTIAEADEIRLVVELNAALGEKFEKAYAPILLDNLGSLRAASKILKLVPVDRAVTLVREAAFAFTPDKTGGELPRSLGHPFLFKYVTNEWRRIRRDQERGQLPFLFVEQTAPRTVYGCRAPGAPLVEVGKPEPPASADAIDKGREEFLSLANSPLKPRRI